MLKTTVSLFFLANHDVDVAVFNIGDDIKGITVRFLKIEEDIYFLCGIMNVFVIVGISRRHILVIIVFFLKELNFYYLSF